MKAIELDQFTRFHFLSSLGISADKKDLYFVLSKIDMEDNGYKQKLVAYNIASGSFKDVTDYEKSMAYFTLKDGVYFIKNDPEKKGVFSTFYKVEEDGNLVFRPYSKYSARWEDDFTQKFIDAWNDPSLMEETCLDLAQSMNEILSQE